MKRAADDAVGAKPPDAVAVPHQPTGERAAEPADIEPGSCGAGAPEAPSALDERQVQMLDFERRWWRHAGSKEQAIRDTFDLSPTRYYQLLNGLLDEPAALAHDATTVNRLRRMRAGPGQQRGSDRGDRLRRLRVAAARRVSLAHDPVPG